MFLIDQICLAILHLFNLLESQRIVFNSDDLFQWRISPFKIQDKTATPLGSHVLMGQICFSLFCILYFCRSPCRHLCKIILKFNENFHSAPLLLLLFCCLLLPSFRGFYGFSIMLFFVSFLVLRSS